MLEELVKFEKVFSNFINNQVGFRDAEINKKRAYYANANKLIQEILYKHIEEIQFTTPATTIVDVLNFNYSLDMRFTEYLERNFDSRAGLKINSWSNIHGVASYNLEDAKEKINESKGISGINNYMELPGPIFGIDNHEILEKENSNFDDSRSIFTKLFRLMDNHINEIRNNTFQQEVDTITFFGHSLSSADYSYFESIFDQYDIFNSRVKLEFYYYSGDLSKAKTEVEKKAISKREERKTMKNIVKLLSSYGSTLKNIYGENIVNKLILEKCLSVIPNPTK